MEHRSRIRAFFSANRQAIIFFLLFVVLFLVFQRVYVHTRELSANLLTNRLNANVASAIINLLSPEEPSVVEGSVIAGAGVRIDIMKGCEGFEVMLLLVAGILAFPRKMKYKLLGIVIGVALIYPVNLLRIVSLFYVLKLAPRHFDFAHLTLWQSIIILLVALYFLFWVRHLSGKYERAT